jgi:hypothetical protein
LKGFNFTTAADREIVRDMKEKTAYVAMDVCVESEMAEKSQKCDKSYELPDGERIVVGRERFYAMEGMF